VRAALLSENIRALSTLDAGTALLFRQAGLTLTPAESLVQRVCGLLDGGGIASHERAAAALYGIVKQCWGVVNKAFLTNTPISEGDIRHQMLSEMDKLGLETEGSPIVAAGEHTAMAHYDFAGEGALFRRGDVIQFDLWAREKDAVWADISWAGVFDTAPAPAVAKAWDALTDAREAVVACIEARLAAGERPTGAMLDDLARRRLEAAGYAAAIAHRTGHGIDTECHGVGVNLDAHEFPDGRRLLDGACFSIEPGLYFEKERPAFGLRTEINMWISDGKGTVSGGERQRALLTCGGDIG
jgi:Xaa-Pro aminopeptidase